MTKSDPTSAPGLRVRGTWPQPLQLALGWAKAWARPWNDDYPASALRLERGSARFLRTCTEYVADLSSPVLSQALIPSRARMWEDAGYEVADRLALLEHDLRSIPATENGRHVVAGPLGSGDDLYDIDQAAFGVRWRMGKAGLDESYTATKRAIVHRVREGPDVVAFAVTGVSLGQGYLQRLAVHPRFQKRGHGAMLVATSLRWARSQGARTVLVNTQMDNDDALRLYRRLGFAAVPEGLVVMASPA